MMIDLALALKLGGGLLGGLWTLLTGFAAVVYHNQKASFAEVKEMIHEMGAAFAKAQEKSADERTQTHGRLASLEARVAILETHKNAVHPDAHVVHS